MLSRRDFLKKGIISAAAFSLMPYMDLKSYFSEWPDAERLGRNCAGGWITLRAQPSSNSAEVGKLYEDDVVVWLREVIGEAPSGVLSKKWIETPQGYVYATNLQPVMYKPNEPVQSLPTSSLGNGMWAEVTIPYVDLVLPNPAIAPWLKEVEHPRLYYSQIMWIDEIKKGTDGRVIYRVNEHYGTYGDVFEASAEAFRPITEEEITPINPDAENKKIVVNLNYQTLSCYEGNNEVYFCQISSGAKFDAIGDQVDEWATPLGAHLPWRKAISFHMSGGASGAGWDTPGIGWTILFDPDGAGIHSTFWHNNFGMPKSHGCVNAKPEDAKWIFRWTNPYVSCDPGNIDISGPGGTVIDVVEL